MAGGSGVGRGSLTVLLGARRAGVQRSGPPPGPQDPHHKTTPSPQDSLTTRPPHETPHKTLTRSATLAGNHHVRRHGWPSAEPPARGARLTGPRCRQKKPLGRGTQSAVGRDAKHCGAEAAPRTRRAPGYLGGWGPGDWNRPAIIGACLELSPQGEAGETAFVRKGLARQAGSKPRACKR